ncbi:MAG: HEAT repeat domain-containing protein [Nitrospiria bacterium]
MNENVKSDSAIDPRYFMNVLIELQVGIRKLSLYSLSHNLVPTLLENLEKHFNILFEFVAEVTLGITRNEFIYQGINISSANPVIRELARRMNQLGLASMAFKKGLLKEDIFKFLKFIIESGKTTPSKREEDVSQLHQETQYIRVKLIRFGEALKSVRSEEEPEEGQSNIQDRNGLWRNLVTTLMDGSTESVNPTNGLQSDEKANTEDLAELINHLCKSGPKESKSYEHTIVKYLNTQEENQNLTPEERIRFNRELSNLLTRLEPEVRQQIFRISLEETEKEKGPLEEVLPFFSEPMLLEVFNQIHQSNRNISAPMLSLLNKFTELSEQNNQLKDVLTSNLKEDDNIFRELLTNKADRVFYPSSYRALLDQELVHKPDESALSSSAEVAAIEPAAVNYHLSLIILELFERPDGSPSEYENLIDLFNRLQKEGLGNQTHEVMENFLLLVFNKLEKASTENRKVFETKVIKYMSPDFLSSLLQRLRTSGDERFSKLFAYMRDLAGADLIRILLDQLETEENMSTRKYLLQQIILCGKAVIPQAVKRLRSPKWFVVRNMLVLLKDLKAREGLPEIYRYFMEANSSKVKLAALQALETIGRKTEYFYKGILAALGDRDPSLIRHAVSVILSSHDPEALEILKTLILNLYKKENAMTILQMVKRSNATELTLSLQKLRRSLKFRFWQGSHVRAMLKTVNETLKAFSKIGIDHA